MAPRRRLSTSAQDARDRALEAVSLMRREGLSLTKAARNAGTTLDTVRKYARSALRKNTAGAWKATRWDRLARRMRFPTAMGPIDLEIRDSRSASILGSYWAAVDRYLKTGDSEALMPFERKGIRVGGRVWPLITEARVLRRLAGAGIVEFEDIYARIQ